MSELDEFKEFARLLADASAEIIRGFFRAGISVERKEDETPVTIADKLAEEKMRELIEKEFPEHGILGEEFGEKKSASEYSWVIDPIDGTKSFVAGAISFGTLIALVKNGVPLLGVINHPILKEFLIGDNRNAELNGETVKVRACSDISEAVLLTTDHFNVHKYQNGEKFEKLIRRVRLYRTWGNCYGYYLLATGGADAMLDPIMSVWDTMALVPVVRGAGGTITGYNGGDPLEENSVIASSSAIHPVLIEELN
jgi:myo-inositol-1(or 4)-monophosphatase